MNLLGFEVAGANRSDHGEIAVANSGFLPKAAARFIGSRVASVWFLATLGCFLARVADGAPSSGAEVAVVYNLNLGPDSRLVAEHYAERRGVPADQVIGLALPRAESMTRAEFRAQLQEPLLRALESRGSLTFYRQIVPAQEGRPGSVTRIPTEAKVRYLVLCYGVPVRILHDETIVEAGWDKRPPPARRTEAAVDSELALLPAIDRGLSLGGPYRNAFFGVSNVVLLQPTNGILMVARLDGPSGSIASALVDKAMEAETNGLWGRAYFDARGLTEGAYKHGDDWIRAAAGVATRQGFETVLDEKPATFPASFPMPQIALYAGWYDGAVSGPFSRPTVEFMPGAFAYHLFSFSANTVREPSSWVGALLAKGATATVGYVFEPYLDITIDVGVFTARWLDAGWTFGEATYAASPALSWQTTVIGDPLYRPATHSVLELREDLKRRGSPLLEWAELRLLNRELAAGTAADQIIARLTRLAETRQSSVLEQKLGDLYFQEGKAAQGIDEYRKALRLKPSGQQQAHLLLAVARRCAVLQRDAEALEAFETLFSAHKDFPDLLAFYQEALPVARHAGNARLVEKYEAEIKRLTPPPPPPKPADEKKP